MEGEPENLPTIISEISEIEHVMRSDRDGYNRDVEKQGRLRDLYRQREEYRSTTIIDQNSSGMDVMAPVGMEEFRRENPTGDYGAYLGQLREAADVMLSVPSSERAGFAAAFDRLPDTVVGAMMSVLTDRHTLVSGYCSDAEVQKFAKEPGGSIVRDWGHEAQQKMGRCRAKLWHVIERLETDADAERFVSWLTGLSDKAAAAVYRKLAV